MKAAGHSVSLLAPSAAGAALCGGGPAEVDSVLPWESATFAALLAGDASVSSDLCGALAPFHAVVAYTASADLLHGLGQAAPSAKIVVQPPLPPPAAPHAAAWLAQAVAKLGADPAVTPPSFAASKAESSQARPWLDRLGPGFLAVHPGSGSPRKNWPAERFASLVEQLTGDRPFVLVEGPADVAAAAPAARLASVVHARELPPRVLGAVLACAGLYVGNDSGISHLAAAWGAPVITLFGPTNPAQWAPIGPRVRVMRAEDGKMESLKFEEVLRTAREMLET
ncbi:MAG TPA: glycosyltransferase family 9 protein [Vicinamibacteria bacterium]|nr:glycosyltransferase family 9 protein [Vicinamibacteria bacterium]